MDGRQAPVSIVIPSYNSCLTIRETLRSIFRQTALDSVREVLVVDSSDDGKTRDVLKAFHRDPLRVIELSEKTSPARGRNTGGRAASGELLCFIDSDIILADDWVEQILTQYSQGRLAGGGSISVPSWQEDSVLALGQLYLQLNENLCVGEVRAVPLVPSCNMFCQRELFSRAGGFPLLRASEDTLFCLNLAGLAAIWFVPAARAFHIFREEWAGFKRNQILLGQYISIYRRTHYKSLMYQGIIPVILLPGFLLIKVSRMVSRIRKSGDGHFKKFSKSINVFAAGILYWSWGFIKGCFTKT
jgi:glycosyltransferase involved in cell wall biosynthesis